MMSEVQDQATSEVARIRSSGLVLVVDDVEDAVDEIVEWLISEGWPAQGETDPERALERVLSSNQPAIVVSDVRMPRMTGVELARRIQLSSAPEPIRVILMSAFGEMDIALEGIRAGADDFIAKPIAFELLTQALERSDAELGAMLSQRAMETESHRLRETGQKLVDFINEARGVFAPSQRSRDLDVAYLIKATKLLENMRRKRNSRFMSRFDDDEDVSFDILLYCIQQSLLGRAAPISYALTATSAPQTTASRRVDAMVARGTLKRQSDPADRRRILLLPGEGTVEAFALYVKDLEALGLFRN